MSSIHDEPIDDSREMIADPTSYGAELHVAVRALLAMQRETMPGSKHKYLPDNDAVRAQIKAVESVVAKTTFGF